MSASPAPANADFAERLQRIRDNQGQGIVMVGQSEQYMQPRKQVVQMSRRQELAQNFRYAASGLAVVAAGVVGLVIYSVTYEPPTETCPVVADAPAKPAVLQTGTHKSTGRKALHPEVTTPPADDCTS